MKKIAVILGGLSPEREVSLVSGSEVSKCLKELGHNVLEADPASFSDFLQMAQNLKSEEIDLAFNALHGGSGENGELQAALSLTGIPFTGSGMAASALSMNKYVTKLIATAEGVPVPEGIILYENLLEDYQDTVDYSGFQTKLGLPIVVKPNDAGSSVGISIINNLDGLKSAIDLSFQFSNQVLLEQYIPGRELTVTVLDGKALPVVEIEPQNGWYDYTSKYTKGATVYTAPARITEAEAMLLKVYALRLWKAVSCSGYARFDFRLDGNGFYFLEINTLPGMTPLSLTPMAAKAAGISFGELLQIIINTASNDNKWRKP